MEHNQKIQVKVRWDDIVFGKQRNANTCAIARAIKRQFPGKHVTVEPYQITVRNGDTFRCKVPKEARAFIRTFDVSKLRARPFEFETVLKSD